MLNHRDFFRSTTGVLVVAGLIASAILYAFVHRITRDNERAAEIDAATVEAEYQSALKEARDTRDTLQRDLDRMTRERVDLDGELNRLKAEATTRETELDTARKSLAESETALATATRRAEAMTEDLAAAKSGAERDAASHRASFAELKKRFEAEALAWAETRGGLEQQLAEATRNLNSLRNSEPRREIAALRARIVSLEQKLDTLGNQRNELSRTLRVMRDRQKTPPAPDAPTSGAK